jgi:predicted nucleic acid-binding protein
MVLVDTSVWIDHLRRRDARLVTLLEAADVLVHPFVIGELALGTLRARARVLEMFARMPAASAATHAEVLMFVERRRLAGRGIGYVDAHLLASAALVGARLWTRDERLAKVARELAVG